MARFSSDRNNITVVTTSDDGSTTLTTKYNTILVNGTGINHWINTPPATGLTHFSFALTNWGSEIIGLKNSDSTLWIRIAPSQTATVYLVTGGTAAGVWGYTLAPYQYEDALTETVPFLRLFDAAIGDSNTTGYTGVNYSYPLALSEISGRTIANYAAGGATTTTMLTQLTSALKVADKYLYIMGGTNDTAAAVPVATIEENLESMYQQTRKAGLIAVAIGILPGAAGAYKTDRDAVNAWIEASSSADYFVDVDSLGEVDGSLKAAYDNGDGVHLNSTGLTALAALIDAAIPARYDVFPSRVGDVSDVCTASYINADPAAWAGQVQLESWTTGVTAPDGTATAKGLVANTTSAQHYARGTASGAGAAGIRYDCVWLKSGEQDWCKCLNSSSGSYVVVNLATAAIFATGGASLGGYGIVRDSDGWCFVWMRSNSSAITNDQILIQPYNGPGGTTYEGHGTNPELYVWNPTKSSDLFSPHICDVPKGKIERMEKLGLWERNDCEGLFETAISAVPYRAPGYPSQVRINFAGALTADASQKLITAGAYTNIHASEGYIRNAANSTVPLNAYFAAEKFALLDINSDGDLTLNVGTDYDITGTAYNVTVRLS